MASKVDVSNTAFVPPPKGMTLADCQNAARQFGGAEAQGEFALPNTFHVVAYGASSKAITSVEQAKSFYPLFQEAKKATLKTNYKEPKSMEQQASKMAVPYKLIEKFGPKEGLAQWNVYYNKATTSPGRMGNSMIDMARLAIKNEKQCTEAEMKEILRKNSGQSNGSATYYDTIKRMGTAVDGLLNPKDSSNAKDFNVTAEQRKLLSEIKAKFGQVLDIIPKPKVKK